MCVGRLRTSSTSFGQQLRCPHKRIVNIMKVYIERNNMQVELNDSVKMSTLFTFTFAKLGLSRPTLCFQPIRLDGSRWQRPN